MSATSAKPPASSTSRSRTFSFVVIQYLNPAANRTPRYVRTEGFGNELKTDLVSPFDATRYDDTPVGWMDARENAATFCKHTELDARWCRPMRMDLVLHTPAEG